MYAVNFVGKAKSMTPWKQCHRVRAHQAKLHYYSHLDWICFYISVCVCFVLLTLDTKRTNCEAKSGELLKLMVNMEPFILLLLNQCMFVLNKVSTLCCSMNQTAQIFLKASHWDGIEIYFVFELNTIVSLKDFNWGGTWLRKLIKFEAM